MALYAHDDKAKTTKVGMVWYELNIVNQSINQSVTKVGIELLGQLKIVESWWMCPNNSISCAAIEKVQQQCAWHLMCIIVCCIVRS